jgi:flagellar hook-associated protein 2
VSNTPIATFSGVGSGIDSASLITGLVNAEKSPETKIKSQQANLSSQISILGSMASNVKALGDASDAMNTLSEIQPTAATSSDSSRVSVTATTSAQVGSYRLTVDKLAQAQVSVSGQFASDSKGIAGTGSLQLTVAGKSPVTINYGSTDSLSDIADKINTQLGDSATASVLFDGSKYRLVVASDNTGLAGQITMSEGGSGLGMANKIDAQDASFSLNGVTMTRSSNVITDAISGATLTLNSVTPTGGAATTVAVSTDTSALQKKVQTLVDAYNTVMKQVSNQLSYNGTTKGADTLFGDSSIQGLEGALTNLFASSYNTADGTKLTGRDLGIALASDGTLTFDATKFTQVANANPKNVQKLLIGDGGAGLTGAVSKLVKQYTQFGTGLLVTSQATKQNQIATYNKTIDKIEARADTLETRLRAQFARLDQTMASFQSQQAYVSALFAKND